MTFDFEVSGTAGTVPIKYSLDGSTWVDLATLETELNELGNMTNVAAENGTAEQTVEWRWPFERGGDAAAIAANDEVDTDLGTASAEGTGEGADGRTEYILTIKATATQITPETTTL